jgi:hypothetical protein
LSCIECADEELLAARKAATVAITGSPNGRCDKRCYYDAIMKIGEILYESMNTIRMKELLGQVATMKTIR